MTLHAPWSWIALRRPLYSVLLTAEHKTIIHSTCFPKPQALCLHLRSNGKAQCYVTPSSVKCEHAIGRGFAEANSVVTSTIKQPEGSYNKTKPNKDHNSRRKLTRSRESPSVVLIEALQSTGHLHALPYAGEHLKRDLSYNSPATKARRTDAKSHDRKRIRPASDLTLQSIVAEYIRVTQGGSQPTSIEEYAKARLVVCPTNHEYQELHAVSSYLKIRGYTLRDVKTWAAVLIANDLAESPLRLDCAPLTNGLGSKEIPIFVLAFVLRRETLSPLEVKVILHRIWEFFENERIRWCSSPGVQNSNTNFNGRSPPAIKTPTLVLLVVRLLRHARKVWPSCLPNIAGLVTRHLHIESAGQEGPKQNVKLATFTYNKVLRLLSLPCSIRPVSSSFLQAEAQFNVLARMVAMQPPLTINLEGYRAVTQVQLACKKTTQEQDWDFLKAKSWPPWKQSKTRLDDEKGPDYGVSRAGSVLLQMQQAGYAQGRWGQVANIYAGWDTDRSPTIQKRTSNFIATTTHKRSTAAFWVARIEATRTLKEAWASFLAYEESGQEPNSAVYKSMFEKICMDKKRRDLEARGPEMTRHIVFSGDALEVVADPVSPREAIYVRKPPPTFLGFVAHMIRSGLRPQHDLIAFLIENASSLRLGLALLAQFLPEDQYTDLVGPPNSSVPQLRGSLPDGLVTSFVKLMSKPFGSYVFSEALQPHKPPRIHYPPAQVFHLVKRQSSNYPPLWNALLYVLVKWVRSGHDMDVADREKPKAGAAGFRLQSLIDTCREEMEKRNIAIQPTAFHELCRSVEHYAIRSRKLLELTPRSSENGNSESKRQAESKILLELEQKAQQFLNSGEATRLRHDFHVLVGTYFTCEDLHQWRDDTITPVPNLLNVPNPAVMHAYVRALGFMCDYDGVVNFLEWLTEYQDEVLVYIEEKGSAGIRMMRTTIIAVAAFFTGRAGYASADEKLLARVRELASQISWLGDWPDGTDIDNYIENARSYEVGNYKTKHESGQSGQGDGWIPQ